MTIKSLPAAPEGRPFAREKPDLPAAAMERWNGGIRAARDGDNSISIFDVTSCSACSTQPALKWMRFATSLWTASSSLMIFPATRH